jgi:hypothetical protein
MPGYIPVRLSLHPVQLPQQFWVLSIPDYLIICHEKAHKGCVADIGISSSIYSFYIKNVDSMVNYGV